jgi:hypothetical protein
VGKNRILFAQAALAPNSNRKSLLFEAIVGGGG